MPGLITEAFDYFRQHLGVWVKNEPAQTEEMLRLILERLSLVSITLNDDDDPYLVFESLNAKGMQLTAADLIRNYLFMKIHPDQQDELNEQYWMPMQSALGDSLTVFIWHYLMRNGGNVPLSDVYLSFRKATAGRDVPVVLAELARYAPTYARMLRPELETQRDAVQRALHRLHRTRLTVAYPLIMRFYDQVRHGQQMAESTLLVVLDLLENYALRGFMARRGVGGANKSMQTLASRTNQLDQQPEALLADIRSYLATQNYPSDADVRTALQEHPLYHHAGERNTRTKLLLDTLEASLNPKETVVLSTLSIEHIMPQNLTDSWRATLGEDAVRDHQQLLHTLGNLTLTGYNSELSNSPFVVKQKHYAESNVGLNAELATAPAWNAAAIRERGRRLAQRVLERWPSFAPDSGELTEVVNTPRAASIRPTAVLLCGQRQAVSTWIEVVTGTAWHGWRPVWWGQTCCSGCKQTSLIISISSPMCSVARHCWPRGGTTRGTIAPPATAVIAAPCWNKPALPKPTGSLKPWVKILQLPNLMQRPPLNNAALRIVDAMLDEEGLRVDALYFGS